ncbi:hypothetical protein C0991_006544 [Blastosporella zonata]|nr:hypothetical protein C0991_006544 [Blastosporella zonata]
MRKFFSSLGPKKKYPFNPALDSRTAGPSSHHSRSPSNAVQYGEAPPPYSEKPKALDERKEYLRTPMRKKTEEDALQTLTRYNIILLVDDSLSMAQEQRWEKAQIAFKQLADTACKYDNDGIDVYFMDSKVVGTFKVNIDFTPKRRHTNEQPLSQSSQDIEKVFNYVAPVANHTPMGMRLDSILRPYLHALEEAHKLDPVNFRGIKPINIVILSDGLPSDDPESIIVQAAQRLDAMRCPMSQVGIQFVQVGRDPGASEYLQELDDDLTQTGIRVSRMQRFTFAILIMRQDMVDTTPAELTDGELGPDTLIKILLGGINRRHDRKSNTASKLPGQ